MSDGDSLVANAADEQQVKRARRKARDTIEQNKLDIRTVLGTESGRRFVYRICEEFGAYRSSFSAEPLSMAFMEGQRNAALKITAWVDESDPAGFFRLMQEARNRNVRNAVENKAARIDSATTKE